MLCTSQTLHRYVCDLKEWIASIFRPLSSDDPQRIHIISGLNSDSGANLNASLPVVDMIEDTLYGKGSETSRVDESQLHQALAECRVRKSTAEIELMAYVSYISSLAHVAVMRDAKPGDQSRHVQSLLRPPCTMRLASCMWRIVPFSTLSALSSRVAPSFVAGMFEYQLEAKFLFEVHYNFGARHHAYTPICACGPSGATLHYGHAGAPNDRQLGDDDMALLDMAAEYHCYASDITCSFPLSGSFSPDQRLVYEGVLGAQRAVLTAMRPGVSWLALHEVALRQILSALRKGGVLRRDASLDEMLAAELGATFMPHGLGHLIGIDTHDVGGYLPGTPARSERPGFRSCRTARILEEGMVLTVEPGCYFIDRLLDEALDSPKLSQFICADTLDRFRGKGGVRLEDVIVVTADGCSNLTQCPRTCSEVEAVMKGEQWPPTVDTEPWLRRRWAKFDPSSSRMIGFGGKHQLSPAQ